MLRTLIFKARIECIECGGVVFLDGPVRDALCIACKSRVSVPDDWWDILGDADDDYEELPAAGLRNGSVSKGVTMIYSRGRASAVLCSSCDAPLDLSSFRWNRDSHARCLHCQAETAAYSTPDWLRRHAGRAQYFFGAVRENESVEAEAFHEIPTKPVAMSCINCGGSLTITAQKTRITQCDYCSSDYYIPDAIWFHLHGKRRRRPWFVLYWDQRASP